MELSARSIVRNVYKLVHAGQRSADLNVHLGARPSEFTGWINTYYEESVDNKNGSIAEEGPPDDSQALFGEPAHVKPNIDRAFLEWVWQLFVEQSNVRLVRGDREVKNISLQEAEASHGAEKTMTGAEDGDVNVAALKTHTLPGIASSGEGGDIPIDPTLLTDQTPSVPSPTLMPPVANVGVRLLAPERQIWMALTGHEPDPSRVKPLEFQCLSMIASAGPSGILQHELIALTGQDKRSLPRRTEQLSKDGYVFKRSVTIFLEDIQRLLHTSICIFKRYAPFVDARVQELTDRATAVVASKKKFRGSIRGLVKQTDEKSEVTEHSAHDLNSKSENGFQADTTDVEKLTIPTWTIDRPVYNQIFDVIDRSGLQGMTIAVCCSLIDCPLLTLELTRSLGNR